MIRGTSSRYLPGAVDIMEYRHSLERVSRSLLHTTLRILGFPAQPSTIIDDVVPLEVSSEPSWVHEHMRVMFYTAEHCYPDAAPPLPDVRESFPGSEPVLWSEIQTYFDTLPTSPAIVITLVLILAFISALTFFFARSTATVSGSRKRGAKRRRLQMIELRLRSVTRNRTALKKRLQRLLKTREELSVRLYEQDVEIKAKTSEIASARNTLFDLQQQSSTLVRRTKDQARILNNFRDLSDRQQIQIALLRDDMKDEADKRKAAEVLLEKTSAKLKTAEKLLDEVGRRVETEKPETAPVDLVSPPTTEVSLNGNNPVPETHEADPRKSEADGGPYEAQASPSSTVNDEAAESEHSPVLEEAQLASNGDDSDGYEHLSSPPAIAPCDGTLGEHDPQGPTSDMEKEKTEEEASIAERPTVEGQDEQGQSTGVEAKPLRRGAESSRRPRALFGAALRAIDDNAVRKASSKEEGVVERQKSPTPEDEGKVDPPTRRYRESTRKKKAMWGPQDGTWRRHDAR